MSRPAGPLCDPEGIFELADGEVSSERELELRSHLDHCADCRNLYDDELNLNAHLGERLGVPLDGPEIGETRSVCREVAMFLPTRPMVVRLAWAGLAAGSLLVAGLALNLEGTNPVAFAMGVLDSFWGFVSGLSDVVEAFLAVAGPVLLVAFGVGALVDLVIAGIILSVSRRRAREA